MGQNGSSIGLNHFPSFFIPYKTDEPAQTNQCSSIFYDLEWRYWSYICCCRSFR